MAFFSASDVERVVRRLQARRRCLSGCLRGPRALARFPGLPTDEDCSSDCGTRCCNISSVRHVPKVAAAGSRWKVKPTRLVRDARLYGPHLPRQRIPAVVPEHGLRRVSSCPDGSPALRTQSHRAPALAMPEPSRSHPHDLVRAAGSPLRGSRSNAGLAPPIPGKHKAPGGFPHRGGYAVDPGALCVPRI